MTMAHVSLRDSSLDWNPFQQLVYTYVIFDGISVCSAPRMNWPPMSMFTSFLKCGDMSDQGWVRILILTLGKPWMGYFGHKTSETQIA